jgi:hypothetical protein
MQDALTALEEKFGATSFDQGWGSAPTATEMGFDTDDAKTLPEELFQLLLLFPDLQKLNFSGNRDLEALPKGL